MPVFAPSFRAEVAGTAADFVGAFAGSRPMGPLTIRSVRRLVGAMLLGLAVVIGTGLA